MSVIWFFFFLPMQMQNHGRRAGTTGGPPRIHVLLVPGGVPQSRQQHQKGTPGPAGGSWDQTQRSHDWDHPLFSSLWRQITSFIFSPLKWFLKLASIDLPFVTVTVFIRRGRRFMREPGRLGARPSSLSRSPRHSRGRGWVGDPGEVGGV